MKKNVIILCVALFTLACTEQNEPTSPNAKGGALPGLFSVAPSKQVQFSQGNLQYRSSTNTWHFATNQYDVVGDSIYGNVYKSYTGLIDLFGWGTGNNPTLLSTNSDDYSRFVDWGSNAIRNGGNKSNRWRTLDIDEWSYLFFSRPGADTLFGLGSVNKMNGLILLPDDWELPKGVSFVASTTQGLEYEEDGYFYNAKANNFSHNKYTIEQWGIMESAGAVFLPAAGYRKGTSVSKIGSYASYWSSTPRDTYSALRLTFDANYVSPLGEYDRYCGRSVRLVR